MTFGDSPREENPDYTVEEEKDQEEGDAAEHSRQERRGRVELEGRGLGVCGLVVLRRNNKREKREKELVVVTISFFHRESMECMCHAHHYQVQREVWGMVVVGEERRWDRPNIPQSRRETRWRSWSGRWSNGWWQQPQHQAQR